MSDDFSQVGCLPDLMQNAPLPNTGAEQYKLSLSDKEYFEARVGLQDAPPVLEVDDSGRLVWNFHEGQLRVLESRKRFIIALGGRQSGKSSIGPAWLYEEMRARGPGWYMVVAPTYPVLEDSALPKFLEYFQRHLGLGETRQHPLRFIVSREGERRLFGHAQKNQTIVRFGHGTNASSLEAKTSLACWIDEGGQPEFKSESYEAIEGRHTTTRGRILVTTTPYDLGFLKQRYFDPWEESGHEHPEIDIINWPSTLNPAFPMEEYVRLKGTMPAWRHAMFYDGVFSVPAGLVFDIVKEKEHEISHAPFAVPERWPRHVGIDFGGTNTCAVYAALDPQSRVLYLYSSYYPGVAHRIRDHAANIRAGAYGHIERAIGGAKSEGQWRDEFYESGLLIEEPSIADLHVGIARLYSLFSAGRFKVFNSSTPGLEAWWKQIFDYRYETDPVTGDTLPEMKIIQQNKYHMIDSSRYLASGFPDLTQPLALGAAGGNRQNIDDYRALHGQVLLPDSARPGNARGEEWNARAPLLEPPSGLRSGRSGSIGRTSRIGANSLPRGGRMFEGKTLGPSRIRRF